MAKAPIKEALGLGERLSLGGAYVDCVPAKLADLENCMELWSKSVGVFTNIQAIYHPMNAKQAVPAFEELLHIATGRNFTIDELQEKVSAADGGREVIDFINRFLGIVPSNAAQENGQQ